MTYNLKDYILKVTIINGLIPIHPVIIKVLVILADGPRNHVSDCYQTEKIEPSDPPFRLIPLKIFVVKGINVTAEDPH